MSHKVKASIQSTASHHYKMVSQNQLMLSTNEYVPAVLETSVQILYIYSYDNFFVLE